MKILVCGPRVWLEQKPIEKILREFPRDTVIVHGAARGADMIAGYVAEFLSFEVRPYPVDHALDGPWPAAGPRRNVRMLRAEHPSADGTFVDVGLVFTLTETLSKGTGHMSKLMRAATPKIDVREILYRHAH